MDNPELDTSIKRRSGYTSIPNAIMSDTRLSIEARGLLALLMTFKEGWVFRPNHLIPHCRVGRDKYYRMLGELKEFGYVSVVQIKTEDGKFQSTYWEIIDQPCPEKPDTAKPDSGKHAHIRETNKLSETNSKTPKPPEGGIDPFSENEIQEKPNEDLQYFNKFWSEFPKKTGKPAALKAFNKAIKRELPETIIAGAVNYAKWLRSIKSGDFKPSIKNPQGWLNDDRWADDEINGKDETRPMTYVERLKAGGR